MTTSGGFHVADIATTTPIPATAASGSELVSKFISYYSDSDPLSEKELPAAAVTPVSSVSTPSTSVSGTDQMRPAKAADENSSPTTDSEQNGNGSSESSSSSLGDSATAAARVLAAWQDRAGAPGSLPVVSSAAAVAAAAATASATATDHPSSMAFSGLMPDNHATMWLTAQTPDGRLQSSSSTPRTDHASFAYHKREGSAPVSGVSASAQRRPNMGYLALLNSAAAYVAESSGTSAPDSDARNSGMQSHQHRQLENSRYMSHSDIIANTGLTLSGINSSFSRAGAGVSDDQGGYSAHYGQALTNSEYQDLAQALQHIAATTAGTDSNMLSSAADHERSQAHASGGQHGYGSGNEHMDPMSAAAAVAAAAAAAAAVGSIGPEHMLSGGGQFVGSSNSSYSHMSHDQDVDMADDSHAASRASKGSVSTALAGAAGSTKRKRNDGGGSATSGQTPAKRKTSQASDRSAKNTPHPDSRRAARKWTEEETENLLKGCSKYGVGAWKKILDDSSFTFNNRTSVDLKDRFRTIRAQECAHSPYAKNSGKAGSKEPDVVWPLPPNSQRLQGLQRVQRKPTRNYTHDEDRRLLIGVLRHANHWTKIAADTDLKLNDRPGQSLRDRLRNAFPEVFELFGYVIPKKERADRERHTSPGPSMPPVEPKTPSTPASKRKAPTGSKRLEGKVPENIKAKIMEVLQRMNASLDPHPIPEDEADSSYDADADGDADADADLDVDGDDLGMSALSRSGRDISSTRSSASNSGTNKDTNPSHGKTSSGSRKSARSAAAYGGNRGNDANDAMDVDGKECKNSERDEEDKPLALTASKKTGGRKKAVSKRPRAKSKAALEAAAAAVATMAEAGAQQLNTSSHSSTENGTFSGGVKMEPNDGGIHSAPAHVNSADVDQLGNLSRYTDDDHRRSGTVSAGPFGPHRSFLFDSFSPSVFSRPVGTMTPTDQLDALALEGRALSGYSTPTQSTRRRHSVQADINEVIAAAAAVDAAGLDRNSFSSTLQFFHPGVATGLGHASAANVGAGALQLNSADAIRRMTIGGSEAIGADPYLFPRLPDDDASAAAAAAAAAATVADISAQISSSQNTATTPASDGNQTSQIAVSAALNMTTTSGSVENGVPTSAPLTTSSSVGDMRLVDQSGSGQRGQLRSAQRLLRANGVADDNSIGLSTNPSGDGNRAELEAFSQLSQWFPNFASSGLGWSIGDSHDQLTSESIDPNMLDAGLASAAMVGATAGGPAVGNGLVDGNGPTGGSAVGNGLALNNESTMTHSRRRSQFDWYGLTPSLLAQLEAASVSSAVQAAAAVPPPPPDASAMASLNPFGLGHGSVNQTYRRPSMPIFPTFGYSSSDMLALSGSGMQPQNQVHQSGDGARHDQNMYSTATQDAVAGMVPMNLVENGGSVTDVGAGGFMAGDASGTLSNKPSLSGIGPGVLSTGAVRSRVANGPSQSRRRTMHVPPSLIEDVATAEFNGGEASMPTRALASTLGHSQQQQQQQQNQHQQQAGWRNGSGYPPRPISSGNVSTRQPGTPSSSMLPTVSESTSSLAIRFPQLPAHLETETPDQSQSQSQAQSQFPQQQQQNRHLSVAGAAFTGARHSRSLSGTQFPQDAISSLVGLPGGLIPASTDSTTNGLVSGASNDRNRASNNNNSSMDIDLEAMTSLSTSGSAPIDLNSFKPSLWASSVLFGDDASQLGMHDETRSLVDIRSAGGSSSVGNRDSGGFVDLYRPASSTPTGFSTRASLGTSGAMVSGEGIGSARNPSPILGVQHQAPAADLSPVAPRSAASTPGRREAVGI
ncbi:hypothetical protein GGF39_002303 [Coemansia sp. RSA 1721]|nr:hypothetical protein GGF39_002303 [Coemansia sp. RSA 1721]